MNKKIFFLKKVLLKYIGHIQYYNDNAEGKNYAYNFDLFFLRSIIPILN